MNTEERLRWMFGELVLSGIASDKDMKIDIAETLRVYEWRDLQC